ncbi:hypothetical protein BJ878DRAFT_524982 [Calycina marina]|uniref:Nudix hydrolase domain-containing protein n=1 Tax=Calycina marina TaxID=1763456 RepID=A0A9P7YVY3_9HELO|nr:hypothetical protein BJ878DRAFT_524982 [Calycina marina]
MQRLTTPVHKSPRLFSLLQSARMSTFTLRDTSIKVNLVEGLTKEQLLKFPAFEKWSTRLLHNLSLQSSNHSHEFHTSPYTLRSITIQSIDRFGGESLGFIKLITDISNSEGESLPGAVFLRGASVGMLIVLQPDDLPKDSEEEKHVLLTIQPRIAAGTLEMVELPAGMVDKGTFSGSAAKEIKEELGLEIPESEFISLTSLAIPPSPNPNSEEDIPQAVFPSSGGCDEYIPLFLHEKRVKRATLKEWTGKLTGLREEGEKIRLRLVPLENLWCEGARDAKALSALALWEGLKRTGKL